MPNECSLREDCSAVMFISTKCFAKVQEDLLKKKIEEELGDKKKFVGRCFGKFDLITEFTEESAEVASYKACNIQKNASEVIQNGSNGHYPLCSSLILCNEFKKSEGIVRNSPEENPIRFYSLLVPKNSPIDLDKVLAEVKNNMRLFVTFSYFSFLLIVSGDTFDEVFKDFLEFRKATKNSFLESSTYVAIDWDNKDKKGKRNICASMLLKLNDGFGDLGDVKGNMSIKTKYKRFGSFDFSLLVEAETLYALKDDILTFREKYKEKISHTATSLLMEEKNGTSRE
jgi:hypothetical protein